LRPHELLSASGPPLDKSIDKRAIIRSRFNSYRIPAPRRPRRRRRPTCWPAQHPHARAGPLFPPTLLSNVHPTSRPSLNKKSLPPSPWRKGEPFRTPSEASSLAKQHRPTASRRLLSVSQSLNVSLHVAPQNQSRVVWVNSNQISLTPVCGLAARQGEKATATAGEGRPRKALPRIFRAHLVQQRPHHWLHPPVRLPIDHQATNPGPSWLSRDNHPENEKTATQTPRRPRHSHSPIERPGTVQTFFHRRQTAPPPTLGPLTARQFLAAGTPRFPSARSLIGNRKDNFATGPGRRPPAKATAWPKSHRPHPRPSLLFKYIAKSLPTRRDEIAPGRSFRM